MKNCSAPSAGSEVIWIDWLASALSSLTAKSAQAKTRVVSSVVVTAALPRVGTSLTLVTVTLIVCRSVPPLPSATCTCTT